MNTVKVSLVGLLFLVAMAGLHLYGKDQFFIDDTLEEIRNNILLGQKISGGRIASNSNSHPDELGFVVRRLKLSYEKRIKENHTPSIDLHYEQELIIPVGQMDASSEFQITEQAFTAELSSAGFDISPQSTIAIKKGTLTPIHFAWTIKPKSDGDHNLLLNVSNLLVESTWPKSFETIVDSVYSVNGEKSQIPNGGILKLPIEVVNIFGVTRLTFEIIKYAIGLIGFILMFPLLHELVKKKAGWT